MSYDCSNAHNEFTRDSALQAVEAAVPELLPWVGAALCTATVHVHLGQDGVQTSLRKTRGGDQGDAITALTFPLTYQKVSAAVNEAATTLDAEAREYTYQDDLEQVCTPSAVAAASAAFESACAQVGLRSNRAKMCCSLGRNVDPQSLPAGLKIDNRALVLKHGCSQPLPSMPSETAAPGSQLAAGSPEVQHIYDTRNKFFQRLQRLRAAGLPVLECQSLARQRTGGDYVFVARACGIPEADAVCLDERLKEQLMTLLGLSSSELDATASKRFFLAGRDGGGGFQNIQLTAPAAHAASWHLCLPNVLQRLGIPAVSALVSASAWAGRCLPTATETFRTLVRDSSIDLDDSNALASQHLLAMAPLAAARDEVFAELSNKPAGAAVLRSAGGPGAFTWMMAPSEPAHHQTDAQFAVSVRTRFGLAIPGCHGLCQHRRPTGQICGASLDALGTHARYCAVGGWLIRRHDAARDVLGEWCEEQHCLVQKEVTLPFAHPDRPEARMDLVVYAPGCSVPAYVDVSIVTALSQEALSRGAANHAGRAAEIAAKGKHKDYPLIAVTPFIVEDHGRFGEEALRFLRRIAPTDPRLRSKAIRELYQRLGALLQRHASDAVLSAITVRRSQANARITPAGRAPHVAAASGEVAVPMDVSTAAATDIRLRQTSGSSAPVAVNI